MSLRAFPPIEKIKVIFKNGLHTREDDLKMSESAIENMITSSPRKSKTEYRWEKYPYVFETLKDGNGTVSIELMAKTLNVSRGTIYSDIKKGIPDFEVSSKGTLSRICSTQFNETNNKGEC